MTSTTEQEYLRVTQMISGLTISVPLMQMTIERVARIEKMAATDATMDALNKELRRSLVAVKQPEDYTQLGQVYEAFAEASFRLVMSDRSVLLERTSGTGQQNQKRPDFVHHHSKGDIYFEVKALEISSPLTRHGELGHEALEIAADLDERSRSPGVHFGKPQEISGPLPDMTLAERLHATIDKIANNVKPGQIHYGPTVLVVNLTRFHTIPYGASSLLPVFFHDEPPAESCVSGELWQIGLGRPGERLFKLPDFDGRTNLAGHLERDGILIANPGMMAITFVYPNWELGPQLFTLWDPEFDQSRLVNPLTVSEDDVGDFLRSYSDGLNDTRNEEGWDFRVLPRRA